MSLADQKVETTSLSKVGTWVFEVIVTCWSKGRDNHLQSWKLELRFLKSLSLADQKVETTSPCPKLELRFLKSVLLADKKVGTTPCPKLELRFLKSVSLADQKVETTPYPKLELRFLKLVSLADQKVETTPLGQSYVYIVGFTQEFIYFQTGLWAGNISYEH